MSLRVRSDERRVELVDYTESKDRLEKRWLAILNYPRRDVRRDTDG